MREGVERPKEGRRRGRQKEVSFLALWQRGPLEEQSLVDVHKMLRALTQDLASWVHCSSTFSILNDNKAEKLHNEECAELYSPQGSVPGPVGDHSQLTFALCLWRAPLS